MAVLQRVLATKPSLASSGAVFLYYYVCDTDGEKPASGIQVGDLCICLDGPKIYLGFDATTWRELTKAGSTGYAGTGMLGSGNASSSTYLRGDNTWATPAGGGGGSFTAATVEVNLGSTAKSSGKFTINDANISPSSKVLIQQAPGPYTGKGTQGDEAAMDPLWCVAVPGNGLAVVHWRTMGGIAIAPQLDGSSGRTNLSAPPQDDPQARVQAIVMGRVKGNFKFTYSVAS